MVRLKSNKKKQQNQKNEEKGYFSLRNIRNKENKNLKEKEIDKIYEKNLKPNINTNQNEKIKEDDEMVKVVEKNHSRLDSKYFKNTKKNQNFDKSIFIV